MKAFYKKIFTVSKNNSFISFLNIDTWPRPFWTPVNKEAGVRTRPVAREPFLESPDNFSGRKAIRKITTCLSVKLVFSNVVKGIKRKITAKFRASRHPRFEDTKRIMSTEIRPKSFGTFEERVPKSSFHRPVVCWLSYDGGFKKPFHQGQSYAGTVYNAALNLPCRKYNYDFQFICQTSVPSFLISFASRRMPGQGKLTIFKMASSLSDEEFSRMQVKSKDFELPADFSKVISIFVL